MLEILDVTSALFEFVARMADEKIISDYIGITFELLGVPGRRLAWREDLNLTGWCQRDEITIHNAFTVEELRAGRRTLAIGTSTEIYSYFGWNNPPITDLEAAQLERSGEP